jgi:hypothetical protein
MNESMKQNEEYSYSDYIVVFIDVMGQKDLLRQLAIPANDQEYKQTLDILRDTAGIVLGLRHAFDTFYNSLNAHLLIFSSMLRPRTNR